MEKRLTGVPAVFVTSKEEIISHLARHVKEMFEHSQITVINASY